MSKKLGLLTESQKLLNTGKYHNFQPHARCKH